MDAKNVHVFKGLTLRSSASKPVLEKALSFKVLRFAERFNEKKKPQLLRLNEVREFYLNVYGKRLRSRPGLARPDRKSVTLLRG